MRGDGILIIISINVSSTTIVYKRVGLAAKRYDTIRGVQAIPLAFKRRWKAACSTSRNNKNKQEKKEENQKIKQMCSKNGAGR